LNRIFIGSHSLPPLWFAVSVLQKDHLEKNEASVLANPTSNRRGDHRSEHFIEHENNPSATHKDTRASQSAANTHIEFPALAQMIGLRTLPASSQNRRKLHNLPIHQCPSNAKWGRKTQRREDHRQMQPYINQADRMKKKQDAEQRTASS
jgi:hypothetical protein